MNENVSLTDEHVKLTWVFIQNKDYTMNEKLIYCEILSLSLLEKGCIAANEHFAKKLGVRKEAISRLISSLEKKGVITVKIIEGSRNFAREITVNEILFDYKKQETECYQPITKCLETKETKTVNKRINKENPIISKYKKENSYTDLTIKYLEDFISYRKEIKKAIKTIRPLVQYINNLKELKKYGFEIEDCIELMKNNEWSTVKKNWCKKLNSNENKKEFKTDYELFMENGVNKNG